MTKYQGYVDEIARLKAELARIKGVSVKAWGRFIIDTIGYIPGSWSLEKIAQAIHDKINGGDNG